MKQEAITTELLAMRKRAEQTAQGIKQITHNLYSEQQRLRQAIGEYNAKRVEFFLEELRARKLIWCTRCSEVLPEGEVNFIFLEGREKYSCGYENSYYGFRDFFRFHCACPRCYSEAFDKHGGHGAYDTQAKDQSSFFAFRVEKRDDGYYARKFGNWVKLDDEKCAFPAPPSQLVERFAEEWNLPPRIELDYKNDELVVHERVAMAKAV